MNSQCVELFPAQCRCVDGYVFSQATKQCVSENIAIVRGVHLDVEFETSYYNAKSTEFLMLATRVEKELIAAVDRQFIAGVKVISATPGNNFSYKCMVLLKLSGILQIVILRPVRT